MSQVNVGTIKDAAGLREYFPCTAWINLNGTGTIAIRDSGNVSSIVDITTGQYTINFDNAMANTDYAVCGMVGDQDSTTGNNPKVKLTPARATTSVSVITAASDFNNVMLSIFGGI